MALPQELAVDRPLKLGATFNGNTTDGFLTYRYDFQPDSMQRVSQGDLLFFGAEQEKIKFIPELPEGDAPFHYDGPCNTLQQQDGEDTECVAFFNGSEWVLELVSARISAKHVRGTPQIPGYNVEVEEEPGSQQVAVQPGAHTAGVAHLNEAAADDDIDPDLNDALDEALFAVDRTEDPVSLQQPPAAASPPARMQQHQQSLHHAVQQLSVQQAVPQQPSQQQQQQQQAAQHQEEEEEEDPDDPWAEYDATAAAAPQPAPAASITPQPPAPAQGPSAVGQAPAAGSAQPASTAAAACVRIVSHEEGQDDEEDEEDEEAVHACSDDESDGLGVEVF